MHHGMSILIQEQDSCVKEVMFLDDPAKRLLDKISLFCPEEYSNSLKAEVCFIARLLRATDEGRLTIQPSRSILDSMCPVLLQKRVMFERGDHGANELKSSFYRDEEKSDWLSVKRSSVFVLIEILQALCNTQNYLSRENMFFAIQNMIRSITSLKRNDDALPTRIASHMIELLKERNREENDGSVFHFFCSSGFSSLFQTAKTDHVPTIRVNLKEAVCMPMWGTATNSAFPSVAFVPTFLPGTTQQICSCVLQFRTAFIFSAKEYKEAPVICGESILCLSMDGPFVLYIDSPRFISGDMNIFCYANAADNVYPLQGDAANFRANWSDDRCCIGTSFGMHPHCPSAVRLLPCLSRASLCHGMKTEEPMIVSISEEQAAMLRGDIHNFIPYDLLEKIDGITFDRKKDEDDDTTPPWITFQKTESELKVCMNITHATIGCLRGDVHENEDSKTLYSALIRSLFR